VRANFSAPNLGEVVSTPMRLLAWRPGWQLPSAKTKNARSRQLKQQQHHGDAYPADLPEWRPNFP
jgi:hypothetical protein